jgi:hypothetical protein
MCFIKSTDVFYEVNNALKDLAKNERKFRDRIPH